MTRKDNKLIPQNVFMKSWNAKKTRVLCAGLFLFALLAALVSVLAVHPLHSTRAAGTNTAEDNFQRTDTTLGWGTTTNNDNLTNYAWQRSLNNTNYAFMSKNNGVIVYTGKNGHKIAGYVAVPAHIGGDVLAEITFSVSGHNVGGVMLQVTGGTSWYQADMNTTNSTLEIRKRLNGIMTTVAAIPFSYASNTAYWLRLDVQAANGSEQVNERAWAKGTTEPTVWQVTYTDTHPLPAGSAGAMGDWFKGSPASQQIRFSSWSYAAQGLATPAQ